MAQAQISISFNAQTLLFNQTLDRFGTEAEAFLIIEAFKVHLFFARSGLYIEAQAKSSANSKTDDEWNLEPLKA